MLATSDFVGLYKIPQIDTNELIDAERQALLEVASPYLVNILLSPPTAYWFNVLQNGRSDFLGFKDFLKGLAFLFLIRRGVLTNIPTSPLNGRAKSVKEAPYINTNLPVMIEKNWKLCYEFIAPRRRINAYGTYLSNTATTTDFQITLPITYTADDYNFFEVGQEVIVGGSYETIQVVINSSPANYVIQTTGSYNNDLDINWTLWENFYLKEQIMAI